MSWTHFPSFHLVFSFLNIIFISIVKTCDHHYAACYSTSYTLWTRNQLKMCSLIDANIFSVNVYSINRYILCIKEITAKWLWPINKSCVKCSYSNTKYYMNLKLIICINWTMQLIIILSDKLLPEITPYIELFFCKYLMRVGCFLRKLIKTRLIKFLLPDPLIVKITILIHSRPMLI